jgi:hypothetical protein
MHVLAESEAGLKILVTDTAAIQTGVSLLKVSSLVYSSGEHFSAERIGTAQHLLALGQGVNLPISETA